MSDGPTRTRRAESTVDARTALELADWRRQVAELYAAVRTTADPEMAWRRWCAGRERLFREHPQSPLPAEARTADRLPRYFPYDPALRVLATVEEDAVASVALPGSNEVPMAAQRVATARFDVLGTPCTLAVHWLSGYAGGLFVPFRDTTAGVATYGGGRYILDTVKGADLGTDDGRLVLDLNFSYQPSCSYDSAWSCPLPPPENRLPVPIRGGERSPF